LDIAISKGNVPIRLTEERWMHITMGHPEMAEFYYEILETIEMPDIIYEGNNNANIAIKKLKGVKKIFIVVVYKELNNTDGFIITAYLTKRLQTFNNKKIIWKQ
jgi:hypothetical protein